MYGKGEGNVEFLTGKGSTSILKLTNVLYVPNCDCSLISIGSLDKLGYYLKVMNNQMVVYNKKQKEIAVGDAVGQVYKLRRPDYALAVLPKHSEDCIHRWHARFGHRDPNVIRQLINHDLVRGMTISECQIKQVCESCIKGKISRRPFPQKSMSVSDQPFEVIHTDLCGPISTETPGEQRYIMTLIDDYSRYTYIFLLRQKSQATEVIKNFIEFCVTQFKETDFYVKPDVPSTEKAEQIKAFITKQSTENELHNLGEALGNQINVFEDDDDENAPLSQRILKLSVNQLQGIQPNNPNDDEEVIEQNYQLKDLDDDDEPKTVEQALCGPYAVEWRKVMAEELQPLEQNGT